MGLLKRNKTNKNKTCLHHFPSPGWLSGQNLGLCVNGHEFLAPSADFWSRMLTDTLHSLVCESSRVCNCWIGGKPKPSASTRGREEGSHMGRDLGRTHVALMSPWSRGPWRWVAWPVHHQPLELPAHKPAFQWRHFHFSISFLKRHKGERRWAFSTKLSWVALFKREKVGSTLRPFFFFFFYNGII